MTRSRSIVVLLILASVILVVALALHGNRSKGNLLSHATPIASVQGWPLGHAEVFWNDPYLWLSDHEVFHFMGDTMRGYQAMCFDTRTGADASASGLVSTYGGHVGSASPDGQWVLWDTGKWQNSVHTLAATNRSGQTVRWPEARSVWGDEGFWLPDSRRWVAITYLPTGQRIHGHPVAVRGMMIYSVNPPSVVGIPTPNDSGTSRILGVTLQNRVVLSDALGEQPRLSRQQTQALTLVERSLDPKHPQEQQVQVQRPDEQADSSRFLLSPQGDRVAWFLFSSHPSNPFQWLSLWTRHGYAGGRETLGIWVSSLDGSASRKIGELSGNNTDFAGGPRWTPDGKRISFVQNDTLYTVPAD